VRILIGHNYYQQPGGEDSVFRSHVAMLKSFGHEVCVYERHNDEIKTDLMSRASHVVSLRYSKSSYTQVRSLIRSFKPDIAHFHNIFFVMTPAVLYACKDEGVPVIVSLHNFRLLCINGLFFRDNKPCEDCLHGSRISGLIHRCYRGSLVFSAAAADMTSYHWRRKTWENIVDTYIVATKFSYGKHVQAGIPADRMAVLPHFAEEPPQGLCSAENRGEYALYAGRLSEEKGVDLLLRGWQKVKKIPLWIIGTGPKQKEMEEYIKDHGLTNVKMLGFLESREYLKTLGQAKFLVVPSVCYENFPRVVADAYACGVPVLANTLGTMEEIVEHGRSGLLFTEGDAQNLADKAMEMVCDESKYKQFCANASQLYYEKYTPSKHYAGLMDIYKGIIDASNKEKL
jgi:glycosyltransferase involved in cell wall biosynthesis